MELKLTRRHSLLTATIGELMVNDVLECYILEDVVREPAYYQPVNVWKKYGETAIPRGRYEVQITPSVRFKRDLPLLIGVSGFDGIRIHPGNTDADTDGCLLPGTAYDIHAETVLNSRVAFDRLFNKISKAIAAGEKVFINIA